MSLQLLRGGICACMRCHCPMFLLGFGMGTILSNFHMCGIILVFIIIYNICIAPYKMFRDV